MTMGFGRLGRSGLKVSRLCLGCMSFGKPGEGAHPWVLDEEASRPIIRHALEAGINFFDTANIYADGFSEEIVGRALMDFARRDEVVIATKAWGSWGKGPNQGGLSRKALFQAVDDSLRRLGTDYIDLYQIHRWDNETPIEETLEALNDIIRAGKARCIGASSMHAWQFQKALMISDRNGWARFISTQNHLNLLYREEEREMLPLCREEGIGVIPWSPLARGRLTRPWGDATSRSESDRFGNLLYARTQEADRSVADVVRAIAEARRLKLEEEEAARKAERRSQNVSLHALTRRAVSVKEMRELLQKRELDQLESMDLESIQKEIAALQEA